jgi:hypothetical protein
LYENLAENGFSFKSVKWAGRRAGTVKIGSLVGLLVTLR